jgi:hypothetical protein
VNIGVAAPENGALRLMKSFSRSALRSLGLEPEMGFFLILTGEKFDAAPPESVPPESAPEEPETPEQPVEEPEEPVKEPSGEPQEAPTEEPPNEKEPTEEPPAKDSPAPVPPTPPPPAPAKGEWSPLEDPSALFDDPDIAAACQNAKGALVKEEYGVTLLAIPVIAGTPFPMMPVFCFGDYVVIDGREYVVFKIKNGNFVM